MFNNIMSTLMMHFVNITEIIMPHMETGDLYSDVYMKGHWSLIYVNFKYMMSYPMQNRPIKE